METYMSYICHICFQIHGNIYKRVDDYILTYPYVAYIEISFINKKSKASREEGIRDKQCTKEMPVANKYIQGQFIWMVIKDTQVKQ